MESLKKVIEDLIPNLSVSKQNWVQYFEQHPDLQEIFIKSNVEKETVIASLSLLNQYIEEKGNCHTCTGLSGCNNLLKGHYTKLDFENGQFHSSLNKCDVLKQNESDNYRKLLFKSMYIPKNITSASFKDIEQTTGRTEGLMSLLKFCSNFKTEETQKGVYLYGPLGVGKSHMMAAAANKLAEKGISTLMVYVPDFFREMKNSIQDQTLNEKIEALKNVQVLILDDIGAETISQWERDEILGAILQGRMMKGLPTLYTSNLDYEGLESHLSYSTKGGEEGLKAKRLMERIRHYTEIYFIDGPNRRVSL